MIKKLAENFEPITKILEVYKSTDKLTEIYKKSDSPFENRQEVVPLEITLDDENKDSEYNIKAFPNCSNYTQLIKETLVS